MNTPYAHRTMGERFDRVNERFDEMYRHISTMTRRTVGTLALIGTIMTILGHFEVKPCP